MLTFPRKRESIFKFTKNFLILDTVNFIETYKFTYIVLIKCSKRNYAAPNGAKRLMVISCYNYFAPDGA